MKREDKLTKLIDSVTREDGLLSLGKYGHDELRELLEKAYQVGREEERDKLKEYLKIKEGSTLTSTEQTQ
ncbi:MAG: hypothetical protein GY861_03450 [bacterium]|nr:hypothetical protein [bacterium]